MNEIGLATIQILAGLGLLIVGGEVLVRGASEMAKFFRMSPLLIGLTVVSFGTSAPELAVSLKAVYSNSDALAVGNVVGSNIFNILFVLGGSALIVPLLVNSQLVRRDVPLMIIASMMLMFFARNGELNRWESLLLFGFLIGYLALAFYQSRTENALASISPPAEGATDLAQSGSPGLVWHLLQVVGGVALLAIGANLLIRGASWTAASLGVSELVIGLTVVAIGTSLPEAITSLVAAFRGEREIAVGNVVGSNLFNISAVLGLSGILSPRSIPIPLDAISFDIPVMVVVAFACFPIFASGNIIRRWEGALFMCYLVLYLAFVVLIATDSHHIDKLTTVTYVFVIPLTVLTLAVSCYQSICNRTWNQFQDPGAPPIDSSPP
jgi:cation:H+ antiporter